jgi:hypothetical protein
MNLKAFLKTCAVCMPLLLAAHHAAAAELVNSAEPKVKKIDIRTASEEDRHFLVFCARDDTATAKSMTGHTFLVLGKEDHTARKSSQIAFGLYPKKSGAAEMVKSALGPVPGKFLDEVMNGSLTASTHRLIVEVNASQYREAMRIRDRWADRGEYRLLQRDCVSFIEEVAKKVGLKTPERKRFDALPERFVAEMMRINN